MNLTFSESELPVRLHFERPLTDEELDRFSDLNKPLRFEREPNGDLTVMTPTGSKVGRIESLVVTALTNWAQIEGRGSVYGPSAGFALPENSVRAADAAWVSHAAWNALTPAQQDGFAPLCPEFIIEVRSAKDRLPTLRKKMQMWLANGAQLAWLIDPEQKTVEIYRPDESPELHQNPTSVYGTGPIQGFELILAHIWS